MILSSEFPLKTEESTRWPRRRILDPARFLHVHLAQASPDLLRSLLTTMIDTLMSAEADAVCGAAHGERSEHRTNHATATATATSIPAPDEYEHTWHTSRTHPEPVPAR